MLTNQNTTLLQILLIIMSLMANRIHAGLIPKIPFVMKKSYGGKESTAPIRVITDIDDTVKSSGGVRLFGIALGGIDVRLLFQITIFVFEYIQILIYALYQVDTKKLNLPNFIMSDRHNTSVVTSIQEPFNLHSNYPNINKISLQNYPF